MKFEIDIPEGVKGGIYRIENNIDGRLYIGRTRDFKKRALQHRYKFETLRCNWKIGLLIRQNPDVKFVFRVEEETDDIKNEEERLIAEYGSVESGLNVLRNDEEFCELYREKIRKPKPQKKEKIKAEKPEKEKKITFGWLKNCKTTKRLARTKWLKRIRN